MRSLIFLVLLGALATPAFADDDEGREFLLDAPSTERAEVSLQVKNGPLLGSKAKIVGAAGGWQVHRFLTLGFGGSTLVSHVKPDTQTETGNVNLYYVGGFADSRVYTWHFLTLGVNLYAGWGQLGYRQPVDNEGVKEFKHKDLTATEGSLAVYVHVTKRTDIGLGYGLRRLSDVNLEGIDSGKLDGRFAQVTLRGNL